MVFEKVFANLLNTYLSSFIDDLSSKQLNLGVWSGKFELKNLSVKESALDSLDLPFTVVHGKVGTLSASIPWSSIYTSPVILHMTNILVVAAPNVDAGYDEEKEARLAESAKQKLLEKLEEALKKSQKTAVEKEKNDDFVTKMAAQIIKNVQVRITNVHIRFEDNFTDSLSPYVAGITFEQMVFETQVNLLQDKYKSIAPDDLIYKLVLLENLAIYWNVIPPMSEKTHFVAYADAEKKDELLVQCIASKSCTPTHLTYILNPMTFNANAMINRKPHVDEFTVPVLDLGVGLNEFKIVFNRCQFESLLMLLDSLGRMKLAHPHRKWRPNVPVHGNSAAWWNFAFHAVYEGEVKRKHEEWNWENIRAHRNRCRQYLAAYKEKLRKPKNKEVEETVIELEKSLNVFNILLVRRQAERDVSSEIKKPTKKEKKGWFSWGWGGGGDDEEDDGENLNPVGEIKKEMTPEEKEKLYEAIGYGAAEAVDMPPEFAAHLLSLNINSIKFNIIDDLKKQDIIEVILSSVTVSLSHRPASNGIELTSSVDDLAIVGIENRPLIREETSEKAFYVEIVTNPVAEEFDYGILVRTSPLHFIYDSLTVNSLIEIFTKPDDISLEQIQMMAEMRLNRFKKMSATGLEYAISQHKDLNININFEPLFIVIPGGDLWTGTQSCDALIVSLGRVKIISDINSRRSSNIRDLSKNETQDAIIQMVREAAYENYKFSLTDVQFFLSSSDSWKQDVGFRGQPDLKRLESNRLLHPIKMEFLIQKCIIADDPTLPKLKLKALVPSITFKASNSQIVQTLTILMGISFPESKKEVVKDFPSSDKISIAFNMDEPDLSSFQKIIVPGEDDEVDSAEAPVIQAIDFIAKFEIEEIFCHFKSGAGPLLKLLISNFGLSATKGLDSLEADIHLGGLLIQAPGVNNEEVNLLETKKGEHLLKIQYQMLDDKSPNFNADYLQKVLIVMNEASSTVDHLAIGNVMAWSENITKQLPQKRLNEVGEELRRSASSLSSLAFESFEPRRNVMEKRKKKKKLRRKRQKKLQTLKTIEAQFQIEKITISIKNVLSSQINGLNGNVAIFGSSRLEANIEWSNFTVLNRIKDNRSLVFEEIVGSTSTEDLLKLSAIIYSEDEVNDGLSDVDIKVVVKFSELRVIFLNEFVEHVLLFLSNFEAAKQKALDATLAAADFAKQKAVNAYEKCTKLGLEVSLDAPKILIPRNWESTNCLVLDLGKIDITNTFKTRQKAVLDTMVLQLSSTRVSVQDDAHSNNNLNDILQPISFTINVTRNLSFGVQKAFPEIEVSAILAEVDLRLSQFDLQLAMNILSENISKGADNKPEVQESRAPVVEAHLQPSRAGLVQSGQIGGLAMIGEETTAEVHNDAEVTKVKAVNRLKFDFSLPDVRLALFDGLEKITSQKLAEFQMVGFQIFGEMMTDSSLKACLNLTNVTLTDVRPNMSPTAISKLIYGKVSERASATDKIIQINVTMKQKDLLVDMNMSGFILVFALDYLLKLSDVFLSGLTTGSSQPAPQVTQQAKAEHVPLLESLPSQVGQTVEAVESMTMVVNFKMSKVDVMLIESVSSTDCPSIIFNSEMVANLVQKDNVMNIDGKIGNIQLSMTNLKRYQENDGQIDAYILKPCDLAVLGNINNEIQTKHLDVSLNGVELNISPNAVQVITSILSSIGQENKDSTLEAKEPRISANELLSPKVIGDESSYWFLSSDVCQAKEATEVVSPSTSPDLSPTTSTGKTRDIIMLRICDVMVVVESGGIASLPLIKLRTSLTGSFKNMNKLEADLSLEMQYFNEKLVAWEPMIEPLDPRGSRLWSCCLRALMTPEENYTKVAAAIESSEKLELTVSKTCLSVLSDLGENFNQAVKKSHQLRHTEDVIEVHNCIGFDILVIIDTKKLKSAVAPKNKMDNFATIPLKKDEILPLESLIPETRKQEEIDFIVRIARDDQEVDRTIFLKKKSSRLYDLPVMKYPSFRMSWILDITSPDLSKKIVKLASPVEIRNNLEHSMDIHHLVGKEQSEHIKTIEAKSTWFLPLDVVYSEYSLIFLNPGPKYCVPNQGISWKTSTKKPLVVKCESKDESVPDIHFEVTTSEKKIFHEDTNEKSSTICKLDINPTLVIRNLLPIPIIFKIVKCPEKTLAVGAGSQLLQFDPQNPSMEITVPDYMDTTWICCKKLDIEDFDEDDVSVWTFVPAVVVTGSEQRHLYLQVSLSKQFPTSPVVASIFAPFWLVNKTERKLTYKMGDTLLEHSPSLNFPLLFSFKPGKLFKQKLQVAIDDSHYSDGIPIDAVGNQGNILCKSKDKDKSHFCASVDITLSSFSFTKIVTLTSFYSVTNRTEIPVEISEDKKDWILLPATSKISYWPMDVKHSVFFVKSQNAISAPISFKESNTSLLTVGDDMFNAVVDVGETSVNIQLSDYDEGSCPVKIFNYCNSVMEYWQKDVQKKWTLEPRKCSYYVWDEPSGNKQICWKCPGLEDVTLELNTDAYGNVTFIDPDQGKMFWVCFLDGRQRTLLITRIPELATNALQAAEFSKPKISLDVSMKGLGISVVNDEQKQELIYLGISGSETLWEIQKKKGKRYRGLPIKFIGVLEAAYERELITQRASEGALKDQKRILSLPHKIKIDASKLDAIVMLEPMKGLLRRMSAPGFWAAVNLSDHVTQVHAKISRIQIDNQMDNCLFRIIMCPVTPPKSVVQDREPKSFIEFSTVLQKRANLNRFKYLSVLIQEFLIQIDGSFLMALSEFLGKTEEVEESDFEMLVDKDLQAITKEEEINDEQEVVLSKAYYDMIHFSPIKVHVSFSLGGISSWQVLGIFDLLMRSAGVTLTEFKDVTFKIDFFERKNILVDNQELISSATSHYIRQVLKQFYVIVLGLDVIGNPVGLVMGLKQGVGDFFYEPFMGIIEGPEEFAEGLTLGVKSLFSHTVGGAAGALSKITGTLGEGVSALTMDKKFQEERRRRLNQRQNIASGGKELARGFWSGLSGIIRKPIEGAREDGVEGMFKGIGKGAVGVIAQPVTGIVDFASGSLGALKRAVDVNQEATRQRPARVFKKDGILRPYNVENAKGNAILKTLDKGSYVQSDSYVNHAELRHPANGSKQVLLLITDRRIFFLKQSCLFGTWDIVWTETHEGTESVVVENQNTLKFTFKESKTKLCIINDGFQKNAYCHSPDIAKWIWMKIAAVRATLQLQQPEEE